MYVKVRMYKCNIKVILIIELSKENNSAKFEKHNYFRKEYM